MIAASSAVPGHCDSPGPLEPTGNVSRAKFRRRGGTAEGSPNSPARPRFRFVDRSGEIAWSLRASGDPGGESPRVADRVGVTVIIEIDENVAAALAPLTAAVGPPAQVGIAVRAGVEMLVVRAVQASVGEAGRDPEQAGQVRAAHHAGGGARGFQ